MKLHEYQSKALLSLYGTLMLRGGVASTPKDARAATERLSAPCVVKTPAHAGGRGKAGGIRLVNTQEEAEQAAEFIKAGWFTKPLISVVAGQTTPPGKRMGHAGAIVTGSAALASSKISAVTDAGAIIAPTPGEIGATARRVLG